MGMLSIQEEALQSLKGMRAPLFAFLKKLRGYVEYLGGNYSITEGAESTPGEIISERTLDTNLIFIHRYMGIRV